MPGVSVSITHVVWANKRITDIGSHMCNENLITRGTFYFADFSAPDKSIMTYNQFRENGILTHQRFQYANLIAQ